MAQGTDNRAVDIGLGRVRPVRGIPGWMSRRAWPRVVRPQPPLQTAPAFGPPPVKDGTAERLVRLVWSGGLSPALVTFVSMGVVALAGMAFHVGVTAGAAGERPWWPAPAAVVAVLLALSAGRNWASRRPRRRETLVIGSGPLARAVVDAIEGDPSRILIGAVDSPDPGRPCCDALAVVGRLEDIDAILLRTVVDEVVISLPIKSKYDEIQAVIAACERAGVECTLSTQLFSRTIARPRVDCRTGAAPSVRLLMAPDDPRLLLKRGIDIMGALLLGVLAAPLCAAVAIAVKVTSAGPVFFVQERVGYRKRRFAMYKFRTMVQDAEALLPSVERLNEASGHAFKIRKDPRLTSIGACLRQWSLDELPQLWNVLRGDMSLVGPRPMSLRDVSRFDDPSLMRRFSVRPGLTCLWQIGGRANLSFDEWMALDMAYIDRWSARLDLWILFRTVPSVLARRGAA